VSSVDVRRLQRPLPFWGNRLQPVVDRCGHYLGDLLARWP
jgi:hypothetical protein